MSTPSYEALRDKAVKLETINRDLLAALKTVKKIAAYCKTDDDSLEIGQDLDDAVDPAIAKAESPITS